MIVGSMWVRGIKNERRRRIELSRGDVVRIGLLPQSHRDPVEPSQQLSAVAEDKGRIQHHLFSGIENVGPRPLLSPSSIQQPSTRQEVIVFVLTVAAFQHNGAAGTTQVKV